MAASSNQKVVPAGGQRHTSEKQSTESSFNTVFCELNKLELLQTIESVKLGNSNSFSRSI
jgi:hypothetical protein